MPLLALSSSFQVPTKSDGITTSLDGYELIERMMPYASYISAKRSRTCLNSIDWFFDREEKSKSALHVALAFIVIYR